MERVSREYLGSMDAMGVMILPTDTVYGLHARVDDRQSVDVLKTIKARDDERYFITLISSWDHIQQCGVTLSDRHRRMLERLWPGPYTVLLRDDEGETQSFRWPNKHELLMLLDSQGPLYSTSANWHGEPTATSMDMIDDKLSFLVDHIVDEGEILGQSSTIIEVVR